MIPGTDHAAVTSVPKQRQLGLTDEARKATLKRYWDVVAAVGTLVDQSNLFRKPVRWATTSQLCRRDGFRKAACRVYKNQTTARSSTFTLTLSLLRIRSEMRKILARYGVGKIHDGVPAGSPLVNTWPNLEQVLAYYEPHALDMQVQSPMQDAEIDKIRECFLTPALACRESFKTQLAVVMALAEWIDKFELGGEMFFVEFKVLLGLKKAVKMMDACHYAD